MFILFLDEILSAADIPLAIDISNNEPSWVNIEGYETNPVAFKGTPGPHASLLADSSPLTLFEAFVTDELVDVIVVNEMQKLINKTKPVV